MGSSYVSSPPYKDAEALDELRRCLFGSEPTALVCGFIESGVISLAPGLKKHVLIILDHAVQTGFNIRQQSLNVLLDDNNVFQSVPSTLRLEVREMVSTIVRLHFLVEDPEHIAVLVSHKYFSAYSICKDPKSKFLKTLRDSGINTAVTDGIWTRAMAICIRNQGVWIERLREKHEVSLTGAFLSQKQGALIKSSKRYANLSNLFQDLDQIVDCPECSSVTSPSAYFVDLLHQLGMKAADPSKSSPTLLEELFKRRPDLGDLKLSCANTKVLVPYIDLANEALESVAANGSGTVKDTYNADDDADEEYDDYPNDSLSTPVENTNFDVYRKLIQPLIFPLTSFPYNDAIESVRAYLEGLGSSRNELLTVFRAPYRLVPSTMISNTSIHAMSQTVLDRAISAEYLGLVGEDYVAITHEAFQYHEYLDAVNGVQPNSSVESYQSSIGVVTAGAYWGYTADDVMLGDTGLTCVRDQFLSRSGLSFEDTLRVLKTGYLGRRLVISSTSSGKQEFSGLVADMRLRYYPPNTQSSTTLWADDCDDLQAFLRLWRKVGWSLEDLDAAVVMLADKRTTGVDPIIIDGLAEIKRISIMASLPVGDILPLWGDMSTTSAKSIYARLFLQRQVTREDPVFAADANGNYLSSSNLKISDHRQTILSTLLLSDIELSTIVSSAKWIGDSLTLQSISYIYRIGLFSRMLGISPEQYPKVLSLLPPGSNIFLTPRYTRSVLEQFQQLKKLGWTLDTQLFVVGNVMDATGVPSGFVVDTAISVALDIVRGNMSAASDSSIQSNSDKSTDAQRYTQERVAAVSSSLFGEDIGNEVERFVEGPSVVPLSSMLTDQHSVKLVSDILVKLTRAAIPVSLCKLHREEVQYFQGLAGFDFGALSFANINYLRAYADLRDTLPKPKGKNSIFPLMNLYKSLNSWDSSLNFYNQLELVTQWPREKIEAVLAAKYPSLNESQLVDIFKNIPSLCELRDVMEFISRRELHGVSPELLFSLAQPALPGKPTSYQDAAQLRLALSSRRKDLRQAFATADNKLRTSRRTALVQYLLQQPVIRGRGIHDPDELCGYLLIDVQTGPSLRTSRIKQAISTVQTFMQRCILGLEQRFGISNSAISRDDFEYLVRYRLWEANRKAFLYPESWIDPTLRDDKSEQFRTLEAAISQGKPTEDSVSRAVSDYVYSMHGVGNLEIQAYLWDRYDPSGKRSRLHFFARTRMGPWQYYYRTLDLVGEKDNQTAFWKPWEKMSVDIQSHELTGDVFNKCSNSGCYIVPAILGGRLFLFLPHFTLTDLLDEEVKDQSPRDLADKKTSESTKRKQWQMRMGWTEYRKGKWTPKQICADMLPIYGDVNDYKAQWYDWNKDSEADDEEESVAKDLVARLPGIETFKFWVSQRRIQQSTTDVAEDALVIDMERWIGPVNPGAPVLNEYYHRFYAYKLGTFEWRGEGLVLLDLSKVRNSWKWPETVPTNFMKMAWWVEKGGKEPVPKNQLSGMSPLIARLKSPTEPKVYSFTMSFNTIGVGTPTGLVVDVSSANRIQCVIGYPPSDARYTTSDYETSCFYNTVSPLLVHAADGGKDKIYTILSQLPSELRDDGFGQRKRKIPHELANPYSLYTWETAVHTISLLMERFISTHQYELALVVARLLFDPAAVGADSDVTKCWKFIPFQDPAVQTWNPTDQKSGEEGKIDLYEYNLNKASVHAAARGRPVAYMKRIVFKYIETLIALGDQLFQQNTLETIPLAIQRYVEASHLFGPPSLQVPQLGKKSVWSYNNLVTKVGLDSFSNALVHMELEFPFRADYVGSSEPVPFIQTNYFCIPANPQVASLRVLLEDRLYKCRNSLDIDGHKQSLPLFEPPIDPGALVRAAAAGIGPSAVVSDLASPMPRYRFVYLLERALELCRELKEIDARAFAVKEKKDSEALGALNARHNTSVHTLIMDMKRAQRIEELAAVEALEETRRAHVSRLKFWLSLTGDNVPSLSSTSEWQGIQQTISKPTMDELRMSRNEQNEMEFTQKSLDWNEDSNQKEHQASEFDAVPSLYVNLQPWGIGVSLEAGLSILARILRIGAHDSAKESQSFSGKSQMASMSARLEHQLQERREMANQAGREIKITDRMLATARARVAVCDKDIQAQQQQLDNASEMDEWLRSKYTSVQLYEWMDKQYGMIFQRAYSLCSELARQAQRAYFFERPTEHERFLQEAGGGYWDSARHGMLSAENMWLDLKRMEMAYHNKRGHDFELVKNISLRQVDPWALMTLRETGKTEFSLPEFLFDIDFPGHYCRRILSASLIIPCIVGPYTSLNCTLRLCQHKYRVSTEASSGASYLEESMNDPRFRTDNIPINAIAIGSPTANSAATGTGSFSFDFARDRYSPFEGAGVISTWKLELPPTFRQFDYRTISDVVLQLRYTAMDGGFNFGRAASDSVQEKIKKPSPPASAILSILVNVPNDYASSWYTFRSDLQNGRTGRLHMPGMAGMLPFWTQQLAITVDSISVVIVPAPADAVQFKQMTITEYPAVTWDQQTQGFGDDSSTDDYKILVAKNVNKGMEQDWTLTLPLPTDGSVKLTLGALWILVYYYTV
ncbi:hypothetical protein F5Y09DRAFT_327808 [Xylaria sp. FL1042]|nr:hypothetical protein F5Y09DRAFT_327808 [Xylaria sp. FL1042]